MNSEFSLVLGDSCICMWVQKKGVGRRCDVGAEERDGVGDVVWVQKKGVGWEM